MRLTDYSNQIKTKLDATKMVSKLNVSSDEINRLLGFIDFINEHDDDSLDLSPYSMSSFRVPVELAKLFWPSGVFFDASDRRSVDLLMRKESGDVGRPPLKYDEFLTICDKLFSSYKKSVSNTIPLSEIRVRKNLMDVIQLMSVGGKVHDEKGEGWYPMPMVEGVVLFKPSYYNAMAGEVMDEFVRQIAKLFA